jgi:hypothetical protein
MLSDSNFYLSREVHNLLPRMQKHTLGEFKLFKRENIWCTSALEKNLSFIYF